MKKVLLLVILLSCCFSAPSLAQQGSGDPPPSGGGSVQGTATAAAQVNSYGSTQLPTVNSFLGTPGPIPAFSPVNPGEPMLYLPTLFRSLTVKQLRSMAKKHGTRGKIKVSVEVVNDSAVEPNDDPVHFITFLPEPDHVVGISYGESIGPNQDGNLATTILALKERTHTRYALIIVTQGIAGVTQANTLGVTGVVSALAAGKGFGVTPGYLRGSSTTIAQQTFTFRVIGFDFKEPPPEPETKSQAPPPPPSASQPKAGEPKEAAPAVVQQPPAQQPAQPTQPPTPTPQAPPPEAACCKEILQFVVYFDYDRPLKGHYEVPPTYMPEIERAAKWLADHKSCQLEIEGNADQRGGDDYNAALGRRRSRAVYLAMLAQDKTLKDRLKFSSFSKDRPVSSEYRNYGLNRRVILQVVGPESSK